MKTVWLGLAAMCLAAVASVPAQSPPHRSPAETLHHTCVAAERRAVERGEGFGMALVADRNGFPGPRHILDLRQELQLTPAQEQQVQLLYDRMHADALAVGQELLAKETELERLFASGAQDTAAAQRLVQESAALRGKLRWVHLSAHLQARALLTAEQRARYQALRHGSHAH